MCECSEYVSVNNIRNHALSSQPTLKIQLKKMKKNWPIGDFALKYIL